MILYKITNGLGIWYVLSDTATNAQKFLENAFDKEDYGFTSKRKTTNIEIIAEEVQPALSSQYFFSSGNKLLIDKS